MIKIKYCDEMQKLCKKLDEYGIKWSDRSTRYKNVNGKETFTIERIVIIYQQDDKYRDFNTCVSVIHGYCTYGGIDPITGEDDGLLEMMINYNEPRGYLRANDVFEEIIHDTFGHPAYDPEEPLAIYGKKYTI